MKASYRGRRDNPRKNPNPCAYTAKGWFLKIQIPSGVFGYFDGKDLDTGVLIRFIAEHPDGSLHYHSGGGITINSLCHDEYREAIAKVYLPFF